MLFSSVLEGVNFVYSPTNQDKIYIQNRKRETLGEKDERKRGIKCGLDLADGLFHIY
jgi:hypothetical protein